MLLVCSLSSIGLAPGAHSTIIRVRSGVGVPDRRRSGRGRLGASSRVDRRLSSGSGSCSTGRSSSGRDIAALNTAVCHAPCDAEEWTRAPAIFVRIVTATGARQRARSAAPAISVTPLVHLFGHWHPSPRPCAWACPRTQQYSSRQRVPFFGSALLLVRSASKTRLTTAVGRIRSRVAVVKSGRHASLSADFHAAPFARYCICGLAVAASRCLTIRPHRPDILSGPAAVVA